MVGPSGSGKSTRAKYLRDKYINERQDCIIISRDKIREMIFGYTEAQMSDYYNSRTSLAGDEKLVTHTQHTLVNTYLKKGYVVIVDNTHLEMQYITKLQAYGVKVQLVVMEDVEKVDCVIRDEDRVRRVGKKIIDQQWEKFKKLKKFINDGDLKGWMGHYISQSESNPHAVIFDIDGTLAHMNGKRHAFEWEKVGLDDVDIQVREALWAHQKAGKKIIICTGRDYQCREETMNWLSMNDITYDEIFFRPERSYDPDWKVKESMWHQITKSYYISACYDDRDQVVDHARRLGLKVYQVAEGDF